MQQLVAPFLGNLVLSAAVFVVLFALITLLISRKDIPGLLGGLFRAIVSYFYSPFIYLRKATTALAHYAREGEARFVNSEQYLLHKLLLMFSGAVLLVAIGILTVGGVQGTLHVREWSTLHKRIVEATAELDNNRAEQTRLTAFIAKLNDEWQNRRGSLLSGYEKKRGQIATSLEDTNRELEAQAIRAFASDPATGELFQGVLSYMKASSTTAAWQLRQMNGAIHSAVDRSPATQEHKDMIGRYADNWYQARMTLLPLNELGEAELRQATQPAHEDSSRRIEELDQTIPQQEASLRELRSNAVETAKGIAWEPFLAFMRFLAFVWAAGIALEAIALAVLTATNIQRLREKAEGAGSGATAP